MKLKYYPLRLGKVSTLVTFIGRFSIFHISIRLVSCRRHRSMGDNNSDKCVRIGGIPYIRVFNVAAV